MSVRKPPAAEHPGAHLEDLLHTSVSRRGLGRYVAGAAGLAAMAPLGAAAAPGAARFSRLQDIPRGGRLTIARPNDADSLDPAHTTGPSWDIINNVNDQLVCLNDNLEYEGIIAESWEISEDGLEYTFRLRPGIKFHDGSDVDAAAVKFTFDRIIDPATNALSRGWIKPLTATEVIDPLTVKLILSEPFSALLGQLCLNYYCPLPPAAVQEMGEEFSRNPIGAGPWKFKEWVPGSTITLVRNEQYQNFHSYNTNRGAPFLDEVVFTNIPEAETQIAALESGEVDIILLPPREVERFLDDDTYLIVVNPATDGINFIEFNMVDNGGQYGAEFKPPFDDVRMRQAVAYAIDADPVIESVYYGLATRNYGPVATGLFAYNPEIEQYGYHYEPERAQALLDEAGWLDPGDGVREKDGQKLDLKFWAWNDGGTTEKVLQILQNQLAQVGIKTTIEVLELSTWLTSTVDGDWHLSFAGWFWPEPNALKMIAETTHGIGFYDDEEYITLLDQATQVADQAERSAFYFQASQKLLADAAMIPLWSPLAARAVRKSFTGYKPGPQMYGSYIDIYIED